MIDKCSDMHINSINKICDIFQKIEKIPLDKEENELLNNLKNIDSNLNENGFYFEDLNTFLNDYRNDNFKLDKISIEEIKKILLKEIEIK